MGRFIEGKNRTPAFAARGLQPDFQRPRTAACVSTSKSRKTDCTSMTFELQPVCALKPLHFVGRSVKRPQSGSQDNCQNAKACSARHSLVCRAVIFLIH